MLPLIEAGAKKLYLLIPKIFQLEIVLCYMHHHGAIDRNILYIQKVTITIFY